MDTPKAGKNPVKEGARILQDAVPPPDESFAGGVEAHINARKMDPAYGRAYGLGEYVEPEPQHSEVVDLHGHAVPVAFPLYFRRFFARQDERRLAEWDEIIDERLDKEAANRVKQATDKRRKVWRNAAGGVLLAMIFAGKWIVEQVSWVSENLPILRTIWHFIFGART